MAAWGVTKNLFQRGDAEEVTDPALTAAPLARPGEVVKVVRGTEAEHLAALPPDAPKLKKKAKAEKPVKPANARKPEPRPSRADLDAAEDALDAARTGFETRLGELARREAELARDRRSLDGERRTTLETLEAAREKAHDRYEQALTTWREEER